MTNQQKIDDIIDKILNREKFEFDLNGNALYNQYKDSATRQGKLAAEDAIGMASAMTGGYGNSYAQSVGQQAYRAQLENLNDIVPELYQMAYDKYNMEGQDLYNQYSILGDREKLEYDRYRDTVADNQWQAAYDYQVERDKVADQQWATEFREDKRQFNANLRNQQNQPEKLEEEDEPQKYTYEETPAVTSFVAKIRTPSEFSRGSNSDKQKYKTYEAYVDAMIEKYDSDLTDNDIATILAKLGL